MTMEYQTEFLERIARTPKAVSYRFKRPPDFEFTAGQYMFVDIGNNLVHPLTISSCPEETGFIEFTKRMTGSPYCMRLESLARGETIRVKGPTGSFHFDYSSGTVVMIAGGIGITPIRSILKSLEKKDGNHCTIILIYGNLNSGDIAFRDELENIKLPDYRLVHVLSDAAGMENVYRGYITAEIIAKEVPQTVNYSCMISGPPAMVKAIGKALHTLGVSQGQIRTDVFFGYH